MSSNRSMISVIADAIAVVTGLFQDSAICLGLIILQSSSTSCLRLSVYTLLSPNYLPTVWLQRGPADDARGLACLLCSVKGWAWIHHMGWRKWHAARLSPHCLHLVLRNPVMRTHALHCSFDFSTK